MAFSAHRGPPPPESPLPEDWIARIRAGEEAAFERLFRTYYDPLRRVVRAIAALPPRTRAAFVLSRAEGLSYREVASHMGISPKTVGVHIGRPLPAEAVEDLLPAVPAAGR